MKIAGAEAGSFSQRYEFGDPDPYQNVMDPQPWFLRYGTIFGLPGSISTKGH
jgi:hypothetical protein